MQTTTLSAPDIMCDGCANAIKKALGRIAGVSAVEIDIPAKSVSVSHSEAVSRETLTVALDRAGFPVAA